MINKFFDLFKRDPLIGDAKEGDFIIIQEGKNKYCICLVYLKYQYFMTYMKLEYLPTLDEAIKKIDECINEEVINNEYILNNKLPKRVF
jgi:hypothetical protein